MSKILGTYVNGNTIVAIFNDGTKIRYIRDGEKAAPEFPESMDLKITNRCDLGCPMCAEQSTPHGKHANLNHPILDTIQPYTELAIGGGNPLCHPDLLDFLSRMKDRNVICNLTVNATHFMRNIYSINKLYSFEFIHGLGVSIPSEVPHGLIDVLQEFPNAVVHTIAGVTPTGVFKNLAGHNLNLLVLGLKLKGKGSNYYMDQGHNSVNKMVWVRQNINKMRSKFKAIAFDNLAVEQLELCDIIPQDEFDKLYMGNDGEHTMYIDLVTEMYGKSSRHILRQIDQPTVTDLFRQLREME